jgi:hypothetical protein
MVHIDVHPTHGGKHSATRALHLLALDLKDPPKEVLVGLDPKEGLTDDHEAR